MSKPIDVKRWADYVEKQVGFVLPPAQYRWLANAVLSVATELGFDERMLYNSLQNPVIRQRLIDAVLIAETRFFRDVTTVDFVVNVFEQYLQQTHKPPFLLASIGCSTGQELWSLAMALEQKRIEYEAVHQQPANEFKIIGVDASSRALAIAKSASYSERLFLEIPKQYQHFWHPNQQMWQIHPALSDKAIFVKCNVFSDEEFWAKLSGYRQLMSLVLCQNMLIYFRRFDQRDILSRLVELIKPQGYLVLGAGEGLFWQPTHLHRLQTADETIQINGWQKSP